MTHIYYSYINEEKHQELLKEFLCSFPKDYQNKILKYRRWQDAQSSILGRLLLKQGSKNFDKNFNPNELKFNLNSKPYFEVENIEFNISHSGNIVVCAISDRCEIGIDIEELKEIGISDFKSQMTKNEWVTIYNADDVTASFFDYWTQKEAVLKAHGGGMTISLKSFENINNFTRINNRDFFLREIRIDKGYKCYLAFNGNLDSEILGPTPIDIFKRF